MVVGVRASVVVRGVVGVWLLAGVALGVVVAFQSVRYAFASVALLALCVLLVMFALEEEWREYGYR